jgi:hypothetical protein
MAIGVGEIGWKGSVQKLERVPKELGNALGVQKKMCSCASRC